MKIKSVVLTLIIVLPQLLMAQKNKTVLKTDLDSVSYSMGVAIASNLKTVGLTSINDKLFAQAINEVLAGKDPLIKADDTNPIIQSYLMKIHTQKSAENLAIGRKFLEDNKKQPGVVVLPSGLQYLVLKDSAGVSPTINDKVTCHYHGTLINGKVFDSSVQRGQPAQFNVNGVISGWTEALQLMKTGSKWKLFVPSELAYGEQNMAGIDPNSVLIFEVELISIDK